MIISISQVIFLWFCCVGWMLICCTILFRWLKVFLEIVENITYYEFILGLSYYILRIVLFLFSPSELFIYNIVLQFGREIFKKWNCNGAFIFTVLITSVFYWVLFFSAFIFSYSTWAECVKSKSWFALFAWVV